ncbi:hypothetical protein MVEN_01413500 [Mycena venus]|uniref:Uncharacterized protein n=1 Tax=Mycena venus TaxID=2733690 RepID=A0A8H6XYK2_9AGAR|nr:hypothetical protein MVEN_01413500 [Mycena venus]
MFWPGLGSQRAKATPSQAKAMAFRPSQGRKITNITVSLPITVKVSTIMFGSSCDALEDYVEVASLPNMHIHRSRWELRGKEGKVIKDGWTRFKASDVFDSCIRLYIWSRPHDFWLSQANHVFSRLHITSNFDDYVALCDIIYELRISTTTEDLPPGFLFVCPEEDVQTGPSFFCWPTCPAYWSLDPSGTERLSPDEAMRLRFPFIGLKAEAHGWCWNGDVYVGLRRFHYAKGFDPESQDVARHFGAPLFQLSHEIADYDIDLRMLESENTPTLTSKKIVAPRDSNNVVWNGRLFFESPEEYFVTEPSSFKWSTYRGNWSHDPLAESLCTEDATQLGYSLIQWAPEVAESSSDANVCSGLCDLSLATGFDAEGRNVPSYFGQPVSQFSDVPAIHVDKVAEVYHGLVNRDDEYQDDYSIPTRINMHKNIMERIVKGSLQDGLALRRMALEEKAQLIEMLRLGIFTKEQFISRLGQIEAAT